MTYTIAIWLLNATLLLLFLLSFTHLWRTARRPPPETL